MREEGIIDIHKQETLFWQTRINLIQAPEIFVPKEIPESAVPFYQSPGDIRTFLYDPFGKDPSGTYGLELTANDKKPLKGSKG